MFENVESTIHHIAEWVRLIVEFCGVLVIAWGVSTAIWLYARHIFTREVEDFVALRLTLARYLILALEFQLAADILSTAIAPGWEEIGKLAAIATIRTILNYFLEKEISREVEEIHGGDRKEFNDRVEEATDPT